MALDELHARRLATVVSLVESALDRIELVLRGMEKANAARPSTPHLTTEQLRLVRQKIETVRIRLQEADERFAVQRQLPEPRHVLAAELSSLWVVLENATPKRMKGYGKEWDPADRADWERFIQGLLHDLTQIRSIAIARR